MFWHFFFTSLTGKHPPNSEYKTTLISQYFLQFLYHKTGPMVLLHSSMADLPARAPKQYWPRIGGRPNTNTLEPFASRSTLCKFTLFCGFLRIPFPKTNPYTLCFLCKFTPFCGYLCFQAFLLSGHCTEL